MNQIMGGSAGVVYANRPRPCKLRSEITLDELKYKCSRTERIKRELNAFIDNGLVAI